MACSNLKNVDFVRCLLVRDTSNEYRRQHIKGQGNAALVARQFLAGEDREVFITINLDSGHKINSINIVSIGTVDMSIVHAREVFKSAILSNASAIILAHNHPSGNSKPSEQDIATTQRLFESGKLLGINVLDHVVIGEDEYTSITIQGGKPVLARLFFEPEQ